MIRSSEKKMQGVLYVQFVLFKDSLMFLGLCF